MAVVRTTNTDPAPLERVLPAPHLFTVDEYYRMADIGLLTEDSRVELIDGVIVDMPPIGPGHASSVDRLGDRFRGWLGGGVIVRSQNPVRIGPRSEPEPDLVVVPRRDDYYVSGHPTPPDVLLLVEIADSSLDYDRKTKARLYARAGVVDYWILNLIANEVIVHRDPVGSRYRSIQVLRPGDTIRPVSFPEVEIAISDVLWPRA